MKKHILLSIFCFCYVALAAQQPIISVFEITGNKKSKTSFIKKIISIKQGAVLDSIQIIKDINWITRLPSIAKATYTVTPINGKDYKVTYAISENLTLIPTINIWTSNSDEFAFRIGLNEFNTFGQNIRIGAYYQRDIYSSFGATIKAPFAFSKKWGFELNFQDLVSEEPVFFNQTRVDYRYENKSYEVLANFQWNFQNNIRFGINHYKEFYSYKRGTTTAPVPLELEAEKIGYKVLYTFTNVKFDYYLLSGFQSRLNFQYNHGSNTNLPNFVIAWNDFLYYHRLGTTGNWAYRLRLGASTNDETPFAPFSVDNNLNIRGVGNIIDKGTAAIVFNTEYRQTLLEKGWFVLQGNAFVDAGSWREPGGALSDLTSEKNIRVFPGLGLRFIHKKIFNATFRIDYGYGLIDKNREKTGKRAQGIVFGIGQYF